MDYDIGIVRRRRIISPDDCYFAVPAAASAPFALDGTPQTANSSSANLPLPGFSTTFPNCVVVIPIITNGLSITGVTGGGLTFAREPLLTPPGGGSTMLDMWWAVAASPLSGAVFTLGNSAAFTTGLVFALSGAKTSAPFDVNAAIPATTNSNAVPTATITTTALNTFGFGLTPASASFASPGFTNMSATALTNFLELDYQFFTSPQTGTAFSTANQSASIATAIVQGP